VEQEGESCKKEFSNHSEVPFLLFRERSTASVRNAPLTSRDYTADRRIRSSAIIPAGLVRCRPGTRPRGDEVPRSLDQDQPIGGRVARPSDLPAQHRQLVLEYGDLDVLRVRFGTEPHQSNDATDDQKDER